MFQGFFVQCIGFWIILIMVFLDCLGDDGDSVLYKFPARVQVNWNIVYTNKEERRMNQILWCQRTCHRDTREQQTRTCVVWFGCCTRSLSLPRAVLSFPDDSVGGSLVQGFRFWRHNDTATRICDVSNKKARAKVTGFTGTNIWCVTSIKQTSLYHTYNRQAFSISTAPLTSQNEQE